MVLAMYRVHSSMCSYAGTDERIVLQHTSHHYQRVKVLCTWRLNMVNLNPRVDTVVYHHLELTS